MRYRVQSAQGFFVSDAQFPHTRCADALDAGFGIFHPDAVYGQYSQKGCRMQEGIGCGFRRPAWSGWATASNKCPI